MENVLLPRSECKYTKCYCEENVWKLCDDIRQKHPDALERYFAVFISNHQRQIPLWQQKASNSEPDYMVVWDYHVILVHQSVSGESFVFDLDSRLSFPCNFDEYAAATLHDDSKLRPQFHRLFRVIPAWLYLSTFASDRTHMIGDDGSWLQPPPDYPCIRTPDCDNNINDFISMQTNVGHGQVLDYQSFIMTFSSEHLS